MLLRVQNLLSDGENTNAITQNVDITDFSRKEHISLDQENILSSDAILIPQQKGPSDIMMLEELRQRGAKVY
jgi:hypothetical protein